MYVKCLNTFCKIVKEVLLYFEYLWVYIHNNEIQTHEQKIGFSKDIHQIIVVAFLACLCIECIIYPKSITKAYFLLSNKIFFCGILTTFHLGFNLLIITTEKRYIFPIEMISWIFL